MNLQESWESFTDLINHGVKNKIPVCKAFNKKRCPMDDKNKPQSYKEKHTRWKKYQYCQTNTNKGLYEMAKREARKEIKAAKMGYEKRLSENVETNSKTFWNYVQNYDKRIGEQFGR